MMDRHGFAKGLWKEWSLDEQNCVDLNGNLEACMAFFSNDSVFYCLTRNTLKTIACAGCAGFYNW